MSHSELKISLLMTGDEIMSGDLIDTNSGFICREIAELGGRVGRIVKTGDDPEAIISALKNLTADNTLVVVNGGMGPTEDDHTVDCVCRAFNIQKELNTAAAKHLETWVTSSGYVLNEANKKQSYLPKNCEIIDNIGSCSGFYLSVGQSMLIATPGVPSELKYMWRQIKQYVMERMPRQKTVTRVYKSYGLGESILQEKIDQSGLLKNTAVKLGFRASAPYVDIKLTGRIPADNADLNRLSDTLRDMLGVSMVSSNGEGIPDIIFSLLSTKKLSLSVAESCTGGYVSSLLTAVPGISSVYKGGIVAYSNAFKITTLHVPESIIKNFGAVSAETAHSMLKNILRISDSTHAISVTGIAGPDGGSREKPVGTVFIGVGNRTQKKIYRILLTFGRNGTIPKSSFTALDLLRRFILDPNGEPNYYFPIQQLTPN